MTNPILTIVMPAFNEEVALKKYLPEVIEFCEEKNYKLIVIDDGSKDNTWAVIESFNSVNFKYLSHKVNKGYGAAIKTGINKTDTQYVITIDSDGQHYLEDVEKMCQLIQRTNADMIVGSRPNEKKAYYRNIGKYLIRKFAGILLKNNIKDINSGMKIYNVELAKKYIHLCPDGMSYSDTILLLFLNYKNLVLEEKIKLKSRESGTSTIGTRTAIETILQILNIAVLFKPIKVFGSIAIMIFILSLIWGIPILLDGRGLSVGTLLGILVSVFVFLLGLLVEQVSELRKNIKN